MGVISWAAFINSNGIPLTPLCSYRFPVKELPSSAYFAFVWNFLEILDNG